MVDLYPFFDGLVLYLNDLVAAIGVVEKFEELNRQDVKIFFISETKVIFVLRII